jgi:hypothetical protein
METTLISPEVVSVPEIAAVSLLADPSGMDILERYYDIYVTIAPGGRQV